MKKSEKSNYFSIYLLKKNFNAYNSLDDDHILIKANAKRLPKGGELYIQKNEPKPTWWSEFWEIEDSLEHMNQGAIIFIPITINAEERVFALTFGHAYHALKHTAYEYDFGLRTTLNALDPLKIKSTDTLSPETAKRARIQSPSVSSLSFFDFKSDESIVKKLQGVVKDEYENLFKNVSGTSSLKFSTRVLPENISNLLIELLNIYMKEDFKETFPDLQSILPVNDPSIIDKLNIELLNGFKSRDENLLLTLPDVIYSAQNISYSYGGLRSDNISYADVCIEHYRDYLSNKDFDIDNICFEHFLGHKLVLKDDNGITIKNYPILNCMLFESEVDGVCYHLCDGEWYAIEKDFLVRIKNELDPIFIDKDIDSVNNIQFDFLKDCECKDEEEYNKSLACQFKHLICLDKKSISVRKQSAVEPCDILYCKDDFANFIHLKISTRSSSLSHLFNQGMNSIELIRSEDKSKAKLKGFIENSEHKKIIDDGKYVVIYGIITNKDKSLKSKSLPIFSRISLLRAIKTFRLWNVDCYVVLIKDLYDRKKKK